MSPDCKTTQTEDVAAHFVRLSIHQCHLIVPLVAIAAVLLTDPVAVTPAFSRLLMDELATFAKLYLLVLVLVLGAILGKQIDVSDPRPLNRRRDQL